MLATLEVRSLFQRDSMAVFDAGFMERSVYVVVWGGYALAALWLARRRGDALALILAAERRAGAWRPR